MYPKLSLNNGYRWCPLGKLSRLGLERLITTFEIGMDIIDKYDNDKQRTIYEAINEI